MFEVILSPEASEFYESAVLPLARKPARCFSRPERDPRRHNNIKRFSSKFARYHRYRVSDWRVVYRIADDVMQVRVVSIAHRRDVHE